MAYEVYCYYNVDMLEAVFNGIAMILNSGSYAYLVKTVLTLGVIIMAMVSLGTGRFEGMKWLLVSTIFYIGFLGPKTNVMLVDRITAQPPKVVANIPVGLAFMAHFTSSVGDWMTITMESAFTVLPNTLKFGADPVSITNGQTHGLMFGARLLNDARKAVIADPDLRVDWYNFVRNCTVYDIAEQRIDIKALQSSTDVIAMLGNTSLARMTPQHVAGQPDIDTCINVWGHLSTRTNVDSESVAAKLGRVLNPNAPPNTPDASIRTIVNQQTADMTQLMLGAGSNAVDMVRQASVLNILDSSGAYIGQQLNDPATVSIAMAQAQAERSAESSYITMAKVAESAMPKIRNVIEVVVYATFPIVMLIILIAGHRAGMPLKAYFMTMVWLQLWPPLYAILNMVTTMELAKEAIAISTANGGGFSLASAAALGETSLSAQAIAGYMVMLIPVIAGAITKGGEQAMSSLASSLTAPTQQAASTSGAQVATGNLSYGNTSLDNNSAHNTSMNNHASSLRMDAGPGAMQYVDRMGNTHNISSGGRESFSQAKNSLTDQANISKDSSETYKKAADKSHAESITHSATVASGVASTYEDLVSSAAKLTSGQTVTFTDGKGKTSLSAESIENMRNFIKKDAESVGMDEKDMVTFAAGLNANMTAGDALNGLMDAKGLKGNARTAYVGKLAEQMKIQGSSQEQVAAALSKTVNSSTEAGHQDAYKDLSALQNAAQSGYTSVITNGFSNDQTNSLSAKLAKTHQANTALEKSRKDEVKFSEMAAHEEKLGKTLGSDLLSNTKFGEFLRANNTNYQDFVEKPSAERARIISDYVDAEQSGMFSPENKIFKDRAETVKQPLVSENDVGQHYNNGKGQAGKDFKGNKPKAGALGPDVTRSDIKITGEWITGNTLGDFDEKGNVIANGAAAIDKNAGFLNDKVDTKLAESPAALAAAAAANNPTMQTAAGVAGAVAAANVAASVIPSGGVPHGGTPPIDGGGRMPNYGSQPPSTGGGAFNAATRGFALVGGAIETGSAAQDMYEHGVNGRNAVDMGLGVAAMTHPVGWVAGASTYGTEFAIGKLDSSTGIISENVRKSDLQLTPEAEAYLKKMESEGGTSK